MRKRAGMLAACLVAAGPATAGALDGTWVGSYRCAQGVTPLELFVSSDDDGTPTAYFHFGAGRSNLPEGCFTMQGSVAKGRVSFTAGSWRTQPLGYVTVDLNGAVTGQRYSGTVTGPGCGTFSVERRDLTPIPTPCRKRSDAAT